MRGSGLLDGCQLLYSVKVDVYSEIKRDIALCLLVCISLVLYISVPRPARHVQPKGCM